MYTLHIKLKSLTSKNLSIVLKNLKKLNTFKFLQIIKITLPINKKKIFTVLKSPHVYKKSREHFKYTFYKQKLIFKNTNFLKVFYFNIFLKKYLFKNFIQKSKIIKN